MTVFFECPKAESFGKVLPRIKIYEHVEAGAKLKQLFVDQIDQIVWQYKLTPETINLGATKSIPEIQIFWIKPQGAELNENVMRAIDRAIAFLIIFKLTQPGKRKAIASYKHLSEVGKIKWVVNEYFGTEREVDGDPRQPLPSALNLGALYDKLLSALLPTKYGTEEPIAECVERIKAIRTKQCQTERIKTRLVRDKQLNKRVAINAELRDGTKELQRLGATVTAMN